MSIKESVASTTLFLKFLDFGWKLIWQDLKNVVILICIKIKDQKVLSIEEIDQKTISYQAKKIEKKKTKLE